MYEEKPKGFVEELQSLSDVHKKRVLVIGTIVIMVIVVGVWFSYFNGILAAASQSTVADNATSTAVVAAGAVPQPAPANGPSMWQNIENGMASIGNIFKGHADYKITPQSN